MNYSQKQMSTSLNIDDNNNNFEFFLCIVWYSDEFSASVDNVSQTQFNIKHSNFHMPYESSIKLFGDSFQSS